jgi:hemerythrin-like domain-containing protein
MASQGCVWHPIASSASMIQSVLMEIKRFTPFGTENSFVSHLDRAAMTLLSTFRSFEALDNCHQQIQVRLRELAELADQLEQNDGVDAAARAKAQEIVTFFSTVARAHHAAEELDVFPCLLTSHNTETVAQVRRLIEDHFWIEKYWHDLSPLLEAVSQGTMSGDKVEFAKAVTLFLELCNLHLESEESMIYPEAKARLSRM